MPTTTDTRLRVLSYIVTHLESNRTSPSREEIAVALGLSVRSSVQYHIESLVVDGYLERTPRRHRMLRPTDRGRAAVKNWRDLNS